MFYLQSNVTVSRQHGIRRRDFLKAISTASVAGCGLTWHDRMTLAADDLRRRDMACIVLWMQGGPSQFETFSPKHGDTGGDTKAISTSVSGIQIAEDLPHVSKVMDDICLIRSMTGSEGSHPRASFLMQTGYIPNASVKHPAFGSVVSKQLGDPEHDLPSFVKVGSFGRGGANAGILGVDYAPFLVPQPNQMPNNTKPTTGDARYQRRLGFLQELEEDYAASGGKAVVQDHRKLYGKAARLVTSPKLDAFDISRESDKVRSDYGEGEFAAGCLLARRLVEAGVTFVEVGLNGWDTHDDNANRVRNLCGQVDQPYAQLLRDLKQRGRLENTLVIWMGEFGRTPRINARGGRDHYPRAFNLALAGGGVRGGQVIGSTDKTGARVTDRPVAVNDLFRTFCASLKIDADHENLSGVGRPVPIVEGGEVVSEVLG